MPPLLEMCSTRIAFRAALASTMQRPIAFHESSSPPLAANARLSAAVHEVTAAAASAGGSVVSLWAPLDGAVTTDTHTSSDAARVATTTTGLGQAACGGPGDGAWLCMGES